MKRLIRAGALATIAFGLWTLPAQATGYNPTTTTTTTTIITTTTEPQGDPEPTTTTTTTIPTTTTTVCEDCEPEQQTTTTIRCDAFCSGITTSPSTTVVTTTTAPTTTAPSTTVAPTTQPTVQVDDSFATTAAVPVPDTLPVTGGVDYTLVLAVALTAIGGLVLVLVRI